jgi:hypothetical protein
VVEVEVEDSEVEGAEAEEGAFSVEEAAVRKKGPMKRCRSLIPKVQ